MVKKFAELTTLTFWKGYWVTMRPYLLFVSAVAGMAGFVVGPQRGIAVTLVIFLVFFLSYGFGQALTDCFQMDTDTISSPYRPLVQGVINRSNVLLVSLVGLFAGCIILFLLNPLTLVFALLCVAGLATYTYFKRKWWAGPFYNGWIVAVLSFIGMMAAKGNAHSVFLLFKGNVIALVMLSVFFSYANFVLMGYFKDISADRASGYNTFVVTYGWKKAAVASDTFALLSLIFSGWAISGVLVSNVLISLRLISIPVYSGGLLALVTAQVGIHRIRDEKKAYRPITYVVRGFVLLHLAEICSIRPQWLPLAAFFYIVFELVLKKRPEKRQV